MHEVALSDIFTKWNSILETNSCKKNPYLLVLRMYSVRTYIPHPVFGTTSTSTHGYILPETSTSSRVSQIVESAPFSTVHAPATAETFSDGQFDMWVRQQLREKAVDAFRKLKDGSMCKKRGLASVCSERTARKRRRRMLGLDSVVVLTHSRSVRIPRLRRPLS